MVQHIWRKWNRKNELKKYYYSSKLRKIKNMENAGMSIWGGKETGGFGVSRNVSQWRYSFKIFSIGTYREEGTIYGRKRNEISINGMRG